MSICIECGAELQSNATECPNCGCPVEKNPSYTPTPNTSMTETSTKSKPHSLPINIFAVFAMVIGLIIICFGNNLIKKSPSVSTHRASTYKTSDYSFGADFYTEMYKATDTIVDELSDINSGVSTVSESFNGVIEAMYVCIGTLIIAIGIATSGISLIFIKR